MECRLCAKCIATLWYMSSSPYLKLEMGTELQSDWGGGKQIEERAGRRKEIGWVLTEWNAMDRCWES